MDQKVVMWPLDCALINEAVLGHNGIGYLVVWSPELFQDLVILIHGGRTSHILADDPLRSFE